MNPFFSVIIPNYNHARFLPERLESIFNQTFRDFEVIFLDDFSTDESLEILQSYADHPQVSYFLKNSVNSKGPFRQWKKGIEVAKGKFIWIAESDDYSEIVFLEKIHSFLVRNNENTGLIYTQTIDVNEEGKEIADRLNYTSNFEPNIWNENFVCSGDKFISNYLKVKNVIPNASGVVFRKNLILDNSISEEILRMKMCGDWLFYLNLIKNSSVGFIAEPLNYFRVHPSVSRMHNSFQKKVERLTEEGVIRKHLKDSKIDQESEVKELYKKWFDLHKIKHILKPSFFRILISKSDLNYFLRSFINSKLNG